ncbi:MAG: flippase-like domain-containing protein [Methanosarcinaceae archaeon]|nr:flippase-like domain-containing protein [Methanosarcinaceae archaeon]
METKVSDNKIVMEDPAQPAKRPSVSRLLTVLRILASGALVWFVLRKISAGELLDVWIRTIDHWPYLVLALAIPAIGVTVSALRLRILLEAQGIRLPLIELCKANLVGAFYNQIFPSTIGGDVARGFWISRLKAFAVEKTAPSESILVSFTAIGVDRVIGAFGILVTGLLAAIVSPSIVRQAPGLGAVLPLVAAGIIALALLPRIPARSAGRWLFSISILRKLREKAVMIYGALKAYRTFRRYLAVAFLLSMGLQLTIIAQYWTLAIALQIGVSLWALAILIPIVTLISMLPITINGIGLRENALYVLGVSLGFNASSAVALAWAFLVCKLFWAMPGALMHLQKRPR